MSGAFGTGRLGIVLLNMGGPTSLDAVRPFLENLFLDREIISFGPVEFARAPLARLIARRRAAKVQGNYAMIGGASPIADITRAQAQALQHELARRHPGLQYRVTAGFSYWHPFIAEAWEDLRSSGCADALLLPLYPHYSRTTSGSCFKTWRNLHRARGGRVFRVRSVKSYETHPAYIAALRGRIAEALRRFPDERRARVTLLFSAHGTPEKLVAQGDPYARQIARTVAAVMAGSGLDLPHELSWQSKVGPVRWLQPGTPETVLRLAREGVRDLCVVPVAFVSDHIETLHELGIELRRLAASAGIERFEVTEGLNTSPLFIRALADIVDERIGG